MVKPVDVRATCQDKPGSRGSLWVHRMFNCLLKLLLTRLKLQLISKFHFFIIDLAIKPAHILKNLSDKVPILLDQQAQRIYANQLSNTLSIGKKILHLPRQPL